MSQIIEHMSLLIGADPEATLFEPRVQADASRRTFLHAAVFRKAFAEPTPRDYRPWTNYALLSIALGTPFDFDAEFNGHRCAMTNVPFGQAALLFAGQTGTITHKGLFSTLHVYIPNWMLGDILPKNILTNTIRLLRFPTQGALDTLLDWSRTEGRTEAEDFGAYNALVQLTNQIAGLLKPLKTGERLPSFMVGRARAVMRSRLGDTLRIADIAAALDLSEAHFARGFRNTTGQTPGEALRALRMERARHLLETDTLSVAEVAARVGYADSSSFAKAFAETYGTTPAKWRRRARM
ncbi:MAG: helix-turn-helix domain-containing protein [Pseudomonadota bacterium]